MIGVALCLLLAIAATPACPAESERQGDSIVVRSPDKRLRSRCSRAPLPEGRAQLQYRVSFSGRDVIEPSASESA
jgi:hypothetical protein